MALALVLFQAPAKSYGDDYGEIDIDIAPNVLNLQRPGSCLTVHTDIPYSLVDCGTVELEVERDSVSPYLCKSDDRGYFVAKFSMSTIKDLPLIMDVENTFTLVGETKGEEPEFFWGEQDIKVVDNLPRGRR